ncbi:sorbitol-specific phosphotransferase system component IIA [Rhizobium herbae]|uniref:Sorbitol-specific phosphotransferase system component IIA n=1 Tax=Rhizobium herbae TaxID=508661 RepID=A0ABS4EUH5_9HYPH|nr:sorbitol-specific phosphotransferase system component IIA [Rhizobium herbae]
MNVARSFNNWRKYRQTVTELGRMSSRELLDLGTVAIVFCGRRVFPNIG